MKLAEWVTPEIYNFTFEMQNLYLRLCVYNAEMVKLHGGLCNTLLNTLRLDQIDRHFADDISKCILINEK